jgi:ribosomal protein L19
MGRPFREQAAVVFFSILIALLGCGKTSAQSSPMSARVDLLFAEKDSLARAYVDWVFGYSSSYVSSYLLVAKTIPYAIKEPSDALSQFLKLRTSFYQESFTRTVLRPDEGSDEFISLLRNVLSGRLIERSFSLARDKCDEQQISCLRTEVERLAYLRYLAVEQVNETEVRLSVNRELWSAMEAKTELTPGSVRFARPFIVRGSLIILRVSEFLSILFFVGFALRAFYVPVTGLTLILGASFLAFLIDYGMHHFDRYLHEGDYAIGIQSLLEDGKKHYLTVLVRLIDEHEMRFIAAAENSWR